MGAANLVSPIPPKNPDQSTLAITPEYKPPKPSLLYIPPIALCIGVPFGIAPVAMRVLT